MTGETKKSAEELKSKLLVMREAVEEFAVMAKVVDVANFAAFEGLMHAYVRSCEALMGQGVDFTDLPPHCSIPMPTYEIKRINADMMKVFPGHFLMLAFPPQALLEEKCPICKMGVHVTIQHPAYMMQCITTTCPAKPARLILPALNLTVPIKVMGSGKVNLAY